MVSKKKVSINRKRMKWEGNVKPEKERERSQHGQEKLQHRGAKEAREEKTRPEGDRAQKEQQHPLQDRTEDRDRPHCHIHYSEYIHEPRKDFCHSSIQAKITRSNSI